MESYTLGISCYYHDSAACLLKGDQIIAAATEERFSRIKHDESFPIESINYCLKEAGITLAQVSHVSFYEKPFITFERLFETYLKYAPKGFISFAISFPIWAKEKLFMKGKLLEGLSKLSGLSRKELPKLIFSAHHLSHAASAFYPSPFKSAAIICMDGVGEWATTTIWRGEGEKLELLKQINFPHSLGLLYSAFTYFCGFKVNDGEYKLMGLAPYGDPIYADKIREHLITIKNDGSYELDLSYFDYVTGLKMTNNKFAKLFGGPARIPESDITQREMDLAASIQKVTEEVIQKIVLYAKELTGESQVCLSGGVALNCVSNGKLLENKAVKDLWIQPAASDAGGSLGSAFATYHKFLDKPREIALPDKMKGCYLGSAFTRVEIQKILDQNNYKYDLIENDDELIALTAQRILDDKVVGWFQGRAEFGPRALGNRSILGNPSSPELQRTINLKIKFRESFRPFAPSMLEEEVKEYFDHVKDSPYMLLVDRIKDKHLVELKEEDKSKKGLDRLKVSRSSLPAITHVDSTARIQSVSKASNPKYFNLINEVKKKSGFGVLINTSFNVRSEPIVNSPLDALNCFIKTEMDYLVLENFFLTKEDQPIAQNEESDDEKAMSKKELLVFWAKFYVFIMILSYVTLPFFGLKRTIYPAVIAWLPMAISYFFPSGINYTTIAFIKNLKKVERAINFIFLGIIYYLCLTPYSFLMKMFMKEEAQENDNSYWLEAQEIKINERLF